MTAPRAATPSPGDIDRLGLGFATAKILLTALRLGLFTALAGGPRTPRKLRDELGLHGRGIEDFLHALTALGLLERTPDGYRNAPVARERLVRGPGYAGGFLEGADAVLYPAWAGLEQALRTGAPQNTGGIEDMLADPHRRQGYLGMMDALSAPLAPYVAAALDWRAHTVVADVGGARGNLLSLLLREHPHLRGIVFDRPQNAPACAEHTRGLGTGDRIAFTGGDFFTDALPACDAMVVGHVLADFSEDERRALVRSAYKALAPGGALLVYDPMPDPAHPDLSAAVGSLHMLVMSPAGAGYPPHNCAQWLAEAGFTGVRTLPAGPGNTVVTGHKPKAAAASGNGH
ncbi:methyltransferase [Streptomyces gamaensis]|uniref:Methyltransferase n=1 Tax=Streptomyces gamaensis TaxID=1763542 RepID=A0ABW0Z6Q4_9ACTN